MKPHRTDGVSLSFSLIFLTAVAWWLVAQVVEIELPALGWFAAGALILLGGFGLIGALRSGWADVDPPAEPVAPASGIPAHLHAVIVDELLSDPATSAMPSPSAERWPQPPGSNR